MKMLFTELCLTLCHPMDCSPPDSSVPSQGGLLNPGIKPLSPALQANSLPSKPMQGRKPTSKY